MKTKLGNKLLYIWYRVIAAPFRLLPVKKGRIVCENFFGKGYGDSPKYIAEELLRQDADVEIIWLLKGKNDALLPPQIKAVKRGTLRELYYLSTAQVWIDNSRKHSGVRKRKSQYYMQTWHAGLCLKKVEKNCGDILERNYVRSAKHDSEMADAFLSGSRWNTELIQTAFWYDGTIMEIGIPRSDIFFQEHTSLIQDVRTSFQIPQNVYIVLYAPTFRGKDSVSYYTIDFQKLLQTLHECWGGKWAVLFRLHPNISNEIYAQSCDGKAINASAYPDISRLIAACDLLITDYSSCMFDAMYARKKVILYAADEEEYRKQRGVYFTLQELPFPAAHNNRELQDRIKDYDLQVCRGKEKLFTDKLGVIENGTASAEAVKWILEKCG